MVVSHVNFQLQDRVHNFNGQISVSVKEVPPLILHYMDMAWYAGWQSNISSSASEGLFQTVHITKADFGDSWIPTGSGCSFQMHLNPALEVEVASSFSKTQKQHSPVNPGFSLNSKLFTSCHLTGKKKSFCMCLKCFHVLQQLRTDVCCALCVVRTHSGVGMQGESSEGWLRLDVFPTTFYFLFKENEKQKARMRKDKQDLLLQTRKQS